MPSIIRNTIALGALSAFAAAQTAVVPPKLDAPCADVVIFMARGNNAPYHDDRTFPFVEATCGKATAEGKTCDYMDIQFDVTLGADYCTQIAEGARNGISEITAFNARCPCSHIIVNGYSEGANVVGDVLGGPGGCSFVSSGIDPASKAGSAIAAALLWGDVRHTANQPYNVLDGANKGPAPRNAEDLARLNRYSSVLRSYCAAGDPVCAGGKDVNQHLNYFQLYTDEASSWAIGKVNAAADLCPKPSSSSSSMVASSTAASSASSVAASSASSVAASSVAASSASSVAASPASSVAASSSTGAAASSTGASKPSSTGAAPVSSSAGAGYPAAPASSSAGGSYGASSAAAPPTSATSSAGAPYSTSPVTVSPFPAPLPYDACLITYKVKYVYV